MDKNKLRLLTRRRLPTRLMEVSWRDLVVVLLPIAVLITVVVWVAVTYVRPAPPDTIRLLGGAEGSSYRTHAERYKKIIEGFGVNVEILPSKGSLDNLQRLAGYTQAAAKGTVPGPVPDVGFVQSGLIDGVNIQGLVSLGTVFAQPLMVYYRGAEPVERLSQLKGKRLAVGPEGSGTRALALALLKANESDTAPTLLLPIGGEESAAALAAGTIDAAFLMGDSASPKVMRSMRATPGVAMMNWRQSAGYVRKFRYLTRLTLPEGAIDLGKNNPPHNVELVGPTVELVAREDLHPALSDLLISAAKAVHGVPGMFRDAGEYPNPQMRDFPLSEDAERYYKSGGQFLYRRLPFWLASLVDRLVVLIVPLLVLIVPASKFAPMLYRWRVRSRIYRWYGALMGIERELMARPTPEQRSELLGRLDDIEDAVNEIKTPLSFADQLYVLREHVALVRTRLQNSAQAATRGA
jgi:TRAP-type uncharacterized transport system substrate-binding protein